MNSYDEVFDFVAVGSGGGSFCAALYLCSLGKRVLILEKDYYVGGTTARSGGMMWIPDNPFLKRDGIAESAENALRYLEALAGEHAPAPGNSPERRRAYVREAPKMIEFLLSQGIKLDRAKYWPDYYDEKPGGMECGRSVVSEYFNLNELGQWKNRLRKGFSELPASLEELLAFPFYKTSSYSRTVAIKVIGRILLAWLTGRKYTSAGAALQGRMLQAALREGVEIRPECPVSELIVESDAVTGVVTVREGRPWRIGSKLGVLVNAGGFSKNRLMRDHYQPNASTSWSSASPTDTGEMIQEMARHGAVLAQMEEMVGNQCTLPPGTKDDDIKQGIQLVTAKPHAILVDQSGFRYMNEGGSYMAYCKGILERHKEVPAIPSWAVFDSQYMQKYMLAGKMPGFGTPRRWYDEGYLRKAETLEGLAELLKIDPDALASTVKRFNEFCDKKHDEDFQRGARAYDRWLGDPTRESIEQTLGKIERGPFYAVAVYPGDVGTFGGVLTDLYARVVRQGGGIIPGLYATGTSTASVMGRTYPGAGASIGPAFTWGYVAARHAAIAE